MECNMPSLFISYRSDDNPEASLGIYTQLRNLVGPASIFMDRTGIASGEVWPEKLKDALEDAAVVLLLIGSKWLRCTDHHGRRKIDDPKDWVHQEIIAALSGKKTIIPILIGTSVEMPSRAALPEDIASLGDIQAYRLHDTRWDEDLYALAKLLVERHGFTGPVLGVPLPPKCATVTPLSPEEIDSNLTSLSGWDIYESLLPGEVSRYRMELRKVYEFESFEQAIKFMVDAVEPINRAWHHPRWENQWRTVTINLSTWDIGSRISHLDFELARLLDGLYERTLRRKESQAILS
jgi:pterin-4a-carbinolamine dehydratase